MEIQLMSAELKYQHPLHINWNGLGFRQDRDPPGSDDPSLPGDPQSPWPQGDPETPSYSDLGGDEVKDDYPYPDDSPSEDPETSGDSCLPD